MLSKSKWSTESAVKSLINAIANSKLHLVRFILDAMENDVSSILNASDEKGLSPIVAAVHLKDEKSRQRVLHLLLTKGADPNLVDVSGRTALSFACEMKFNDVVRLLVKWNVEPDVADNLGTTPLMYCASLGNEIGLRILLRCFRRLGLDVDRVDKEGFTALHMAVKNGFPECAKLLMELGQASVTKVDMLVGLTAEGWARSKGWSASQMAVFYNYDPISPSAQMDKPQKFISIDNMNVLICEEAGLASSSQNTQMEREQATHHVYQASTSQDHSGFVSISKRRSGSSYGRVPHTRHTSEKEFVACKSAYYTSPERLQKRMSGLSVSKPSSTDWKGPSNLQDAKKHTS